MTATRERLEALLAQAGLGVSELDPRTGLFVEVSPRYCEIVGYTREELLGLSPLALTHPDDLDDTSRTLADMRDRALPAGAVEKRLVHKDGHILRTARVSVLAGQDDETVLALVEDVTDRERARDEARRGEHRLATLLRTTPSPVILTRESDGTILEVNDAFAALLGWSREEMLGRRALELGFYVDDGTRERMLDEFERTGGIYRMPLRARHKSGALRDVSLTAMSTELRGEACAVGFWEDVTELRRTEAARRESEEELRTMFAAAPVGIVQVDLATRRFSRANERMCAITGYSADELCGMSIEDLTHPDDREATRGQFGRREGASRMEKRYVRKDGSVVTCAVEFRVLGDGGDQAARAIALVEDLTERRSADAALRLQTSVLQAAANAIVITDKRGAVQWVNEAFSRLTGYDAADILGRNPRILKSGKQDRTFYENLWRTILAGNVWRGELVNRRKDGSLYDEEMTITPVRGDGEAISHFVAIKLDITARKRDAAALAEAEERHRLALDATDLGTWRVDVAEGVFTLDERARQHFGLDRPRASLEELLSRVHPDDLARLQASMASMHGSASTGRERIEYRVATPSGEYRRVLVHVQTHFTGEGAARSALFDTGTSRDVTEAAVAREALRASEEQLRVAQRMEAVGRLAGGVAHDFNNILGVILSYSELATEGLRDEDPLRADLEQVSEAARRAAGLTRQLLAFSRRQILQPEAVDLRELVEGLSKMLARLIGEDVSLHVDIARDLFLTRVDPGQIEQVLMNLAVNARDAMALGGTLAIRATNTTVGGELATALDVAPGDYVVMDVRDTGCGIDPVIRARIFEPFFTTKAVGKGTGLGLATVHGIVKQSGGGISVDSTPGRGTTFRVYLPRLVGEVRSSSRVPPPPRHAAGHGSILVVEDEEALRHVIRRVLHSEGYQVQVAANAGEALLLCEKSGAHIDLVLTDVVMPEMSGPELARRLASLCPSARVLFMSGYTDETIERHGALGQHFLRKPFDRVTLARHVRSALEEAS